MVWLVGPAIPKRFFENWCTVGVLRGCEAHFGGGGAERRAIVKYIDKASAANSCERWCY